MLALRAGFAVRARGAQWASKEMNSDAKRAKSLFGFFIVTSIERKHFAFGEFISFDKRHCVRNAYANSEAGPEGVSAERESKKRTKEKRFPRRSNHGASLPSGFFDSPSWLDRKTTHIHVRRPPGLAELRWFT